MVQIPIDNSSIASCPGNPISCSRPHGVRCVLCCRNLGSQSNPPSARFLFYQSFALSSPHFSAHRALCTAWPSGSTYPVISPGISFELLNTAVSCWRSVTGIRCTTAIPVSVSSSHNFPRPLPSFPTVDRLPQIVELKRT